MSIPFQWGPKTSKTIWAAAFIAILLFVGNAIAESTVQGFWETSWKPLFLKVAKAIPVWIYVGVLILTNVGLIVSNISSRNQKYQLYKVSEFYESMFRKISVLQPPLDVTDPKVKRLTNDMLKDLGEALDGAAVRSYLLVVQGDWLVEHSEHLMPSASSASRKFYVGTETTVDGIRSEMRRGVAGECFCMEKIQTDHVSYEKGRYLHDHPRFIHSSNDDVNPGYNSFICIPMMLGDRKIGVLCVDSLDRDIFDSQAQQNYLLGIAVAFAGAFAFATGDISGFSTAVENDSTIGKESKNGTNHRPDQRKHKTRHQHRNKGIFGGQIISKRF